MQTVFNALNDLKQSRVKWDCGTTRIGVLVSDSLMFQRGEPTPSDPWLGNFYGLAMPLVMHGLPVAPVQLENATIPHFLDNCRILFLSYDGQKPLSPEVHAPLAAWIKHGGVLVVCDRDADPYLKVREWWNSAGNTFATPRQHLFGLLGVDDSLPADVFHTVGKGGLLWIKERPADLTTSQAGADRIVAAAKAAAQAGGLKWRETNYLLLRRGNYVIASGLDESLGGEAHRLRGRFVNLFDAALQVQTGISITPGARQFLLDLDAAHSRHPHLLVSACKALLQKQSRKEMDFAVEGVAATPAIMLLESKKAPSSVTLEGQNLTTFDYSAADHLLWIHFENQARPRDLKVVF